MSIKVFISYAWEDEDHKAWVRQLADRLLQNGIEATLDQYDLELGDRLPQFMEQSVNESDYVLVICTPAYKHKADQRSGGVGYEGHIISEELLLKGNERKFIPVIRKGTHENAMPAYLAGKLAVDLSTPEKDEQNFENILATLYGTKKKPKVAKRASEKLIQKPEQHIDVIDDRIGIVGIIVDEVTEPRLDGSPGCALYRIPFRLSKHPSSTWAHFFIDAWNSPPRFSTMHRPGIASINGDKIVLDGTTIEEVRDVHKETLALCADIANQKEEELIKKQRKEERVAKERKEQHKALVESIADEITFERIAFF